MESKRVNIVLAQSILEEVDSQAKELGMNRSNYITHLIVQQMRARQTMDQLASILRTDNTENLLHAIGTLQKRED